MNCTCGKCGDELEARILGFEKDGILMEEWYPCNPYDTMTIFYDGVYVNGINFNYSPDGVMIIEKTEGDYDS
jgi:hypothetical protein